MKTLPKVVMTILARNEEDIIRENIEFHWNMGVSAFVITNNASTDRTSKIIDELKRELNIFTIYEPKLTHDQGAWVTRMAHIAAGELGADWIIHNDADEFWVPKTGSLRTVLGAAGGEAMALKVHRHNAVLMRSAITSNQSFFNRMVVFESNSLNDLGNKLPGKICHRPSDKIRIDEGNHGFHHENWKIAECEDIYILHFPKRSLQQFSSKIEFGTEALERNTRLPKYVGGTWRYLNDIRLKGELKALWDSWLISDSEVDALINSGDYFVDYSVRDFLLRGQ